MLIDELSDSVPHLDIEVNRLDGIASILVISEAKEDLELYSNFEVNYLFELFFRW